MPHERSLVEKLKGRPFAMIGINFGETGGNVAAIEKKFDITWRSFCNLEDMLPPDVSDDLELQMAGAMVLVDSRGIIRYKGEEVKFEKNIGHSIDDEIEALLQEAQPITKNDAAQK